MKSYENTNYEVPILSLFKDNKYPNASELYDTERHAKFIVVERGTYDEQLYQQEYLQGLGLGTLDCVESDYDSLLFHVPEGTRTIGATMQAFSQNVEHSDFVGKTTGNKYLPFVEIGMQLSTLAEANMQFKSRDTIVEKFAIISDATSKHGYKLALLPPYNFQHKPNLHLSLSKIIQEISKVNIDIANKAIMLDSLLAGYVNK